MSPIQQFKSEHSRRIAIVLGVVVGGLWLAMTVYFLVDSKQTTNASKSAVAIHATSPVAIGSTPSATYKAPRVAATPLVHHSSSTTPSWSFVPQNLQSTGATMRIYQTSDATTRHVGGGGNGMGIATTSGHSNNGRGISYGGNMIALAATTPLASPGSAKAVDIASTTDASTPGGKPAIRKVDYDPYDPFLDPIGDVTWPLMLLLTIGWCVRVRLKKQ